MKVVLQKVTEASVAIEGNTKASIQQGYMLLVGVKEGDTTLEADYLARKISNLRVFEDEEGKMNLDVHQVKGSILSISQFTLLADTKKGNRPSFTQSAEPSQALALYDYNNNKLRQDGLEVLEGEFGSHMAVSLVNDGPVTIVFDTDHK